jgi:hypothetical protein
VVEGLAQIVVGDKGTQDLHVVVRRPRQRIGDEAGRIGQSLCRFLELHQAARERFRVGRQDIAFITNHLDRDHCRDP